MTRRRAAVLAALVAVLLGATYLLTRRGSSAPELVPVTPPVPPVPPSPRETADAVGPVSDESDAATAALPVTPAAPVRKSSAERRSWDAAARPAVTPSASPAAALAPVTEPVGTDDAEKPLPTWVRVAIVAAALLAFFAVSLIATKQV